MSNYIIESIQRSVHEPLEMGRSVAFLFNGVNAPNLQFKKFYELFINSKFKDNPFFRNNIVFELALSSYLRNYKSNVKPFLGSIASDFFNSFGGSSSSCCFYYALNTDKYSSYKDMYEKTEFIDLGALIPPNIQKDCQASKVLKNYSDDLATLLRSQTLIDSGVNDSFFEEYKEITRKFHEDLNRYHIERVSYYYIGENSTQAALRVLTDEIIIFNTSKTFFTLSDYMNTIGKMFIEDSFNYVEESNLLLKPYSVYTTHEDPKPVIFLNYISSLKKVLVLNPENTDKFIKTYSVQGINEINMEMFLLVNNISKDTTNFRFLNKEDLKEKYEVIHLTLEDIAKVYDVPIDKISIDI